MADEFAYSFTRLELGVILATFLAEFIENENSLLVSQTYCKVAGKDALVEMYAQTFSRQDYLDRLQAEVIAARKGGDA